MAAQTDAHSRWVTLTGAVVAAWMLLSVPLVIAAPTQELPLVAVAQVVIGGIILGIGRQGVDVLLVRLFIAASGLLAGTFLGQLKLGQTAMCSGPWDCLHELTIGILGFGLFGTLVLALVAVPVTMIWNKGVASLRPESRWPAPRTWWQWLALLLAIAVVVFGSGLILGVPWPA